MKQLSFPIEQYREVEIIGQGIEDGKITTLVKTELVAQNRIKCGVYEIMDVMINKIAKSQLDRKEHKTNKKLQKKIREIGTYKDKDEDSMVIKKGENGILAQSVILEDAEFDLLKKILESATTNVTPKYSEAVSDLWDLIDSAIDIETKKE